jgi:hypothetical protein
VNLFPRGIQAWGVYARAGWWKLKGGFSGRSGFKFTDGFLDNIWRRNPVLAGSKIVNNFQLFGSHFLRSYRTFDIEPYFYIDGTLSEYFYGYGAFDTAEVDETAMRRALAVEREGYASCRKIVVMSRRTAADIIQHYDVSQDQLHIVPPGANIPERMLVSLDEQPERSREPTGGGSRGSRSKHSARDRSRPRRRAYRYVGSRGCRRKDTYY